MDTLRIFLTEDREIIRRGVTGFIEKISDMDVVGSATDGDVAVRLAREFHPDVMIMDVTMPRSMGIPAAERIRDEVRNETFRALCELLTIVSKLTEAESVKVILYRNRNAERVHAEDEEDAAAFGRVRKDAVDGSGFGIFNMHEAQI